MVVHVCLPQAYTSPGVALRVDGGGVDTIG